MKELIDIQSKLKAPKGQYNSFGKYHYRSSEDILEAVKPLLATNNCQLTLSDEIVEVAGRVYVKATAKLSNSEGEVVITAAYAREEEKRAGMDTSQITGSASSYARKYALNGLFCIDDTKDADSTNTHGKTVEEKPQQVAGVDLSEIEYAINGCASTMELTTMFKAHPEWQGVQAILKMFTNRKNQLNNNGKSK